MKTSARNKYEGAIMNIRRGAVNDEIEILLDSSNTRVTATVTNTSSRAMNLEPGRKVVALIREESVILVTDSEGVRFSSRNVFQGAVVSIKENGGLSDVNIRLAGGERMTAMAASEAVVSLGLKAGDELTAVVKAPSVIVGVRE
ncbi:MAG: TOBE domain-containing protein [Synergistaceae bacterium]|nr:TOBE domain-containing protein [Synergistaceae bacterium]